MSQVLSALGGVIAGALATYLVSVRLNRRENRRMHQAAVRAVLYELSANMAVAKAGIGMGSTAACDSLAVAFYADLPDDIAMAVSGAYAMIHSVGLASLASANVEIQAAQSTLLEYAKKSLRLKFPLPSPPGPVTSGA